MKPGQYIKLKTDNRYKDGNIVNKNGKLVGNKETISIKPYDAPGMLNPPMIVGEALAKEIKKAMR